MPASGRPDRRHAALSFLIGLSGSAILAGCQHLTAVGLVTTPRVTPDVDAVTTASFLSTSFQAPEPSAGPRQAESVWTAPPISDYAFERVETPAEARQTAPTEQESTAQHDPGTLVDAGIASTYGQGDGFQGQRTACGQPFDTNVPQVAHKSLACGTLVRVEDTGSGKSVVAEVTDRGPYVKGRVVDLSWAAFSQLQPNAPDLLSVKVYVVDN
jgi:rare lipoprotein A